MNGSESNRYVDLPKELQEVIDYVADLGCDQSQCGGCVTCIAKKIRGDDQTPIDWGIISFDPSEGRAFDEDGKGVKLEYVRDTDDPNLLKVNGQLMRIEKTEFEFGLLTFQCRSLNYSATSDVS